MRSYDSEHMNQNKLIVSTPGVSFGTLMKICITTE